MHANTFYNEFDVELLDRRNPDYRSPFQQDRDRVIYTSAFRRLQAKTQVFAVGEYDFYRTRLTHSIEVAQIGRSICNYLLEHDSLLSETSHVDADLVEAVCLAHDLGHPPFGHAGERTLHEVMRGYGGFEGNAQTLRMMTETIYSRRGARTGMRPTRALMDGVMKYKSIREDLDDPDNHFLYDNQRPNVDFVFGFRTPSGDLRPGEPLNTFRSIECQIMDWADDTAYSLNDLTDGIRAGFLTTERIEAWADSRSLDPEDAKAIEIVLRSLADQDTELAFSSQIGDFIAACSLAERDSFMSDLSNRYRLTLCVEGALRRRARLFSDLATDLVFNTARLQQLEFKARHLLRRIFECYGSAYLSEQNLKMSLLPAHWENVVLAEDHPGRRARLVCDYIAGMTDAFAIRTYKRMIDPDFGSIVDLV